MMHTHDAYMVHMLVFRLWASNVQVLLRRSSSDVDEADQSAAIVCSDSDVDDVDDVDDDGDDDCGGWWNLCGSLMFCTQVFQSLMKFV